jgi:hypothetical protein
MSRMPSAPSPTRLRAAVANGLAYLRSKQSDGGGFCFFKFRYLDRPNLRDSYHAATALRLWGCDVPRKDALVQFLREEKKDDVDGLFYFKRALQALGDDSPNAMDLARVDGLAIPALNLSTCQETDRWLERAYRSLELRRRSGRVEKDETIYRAIQTLERQGGYGERPNLRETRLSLKILDLLGCPPNDLEATRRFVDGLQHAAIGFTDMPASQYGNLEIISAGIECCALLHLPIRYPTDALTFVLACQGADGSFARVPVALPDIAYTHEALQIIAWLVPDLAVREGEGPHTASSDPGAPHDTSQN